MTKAWEDIREQASRLYAEGNSLEQVRAILSRERRFQASVRAFRIKLKEWKVTRASLLEELKLKQAEAIRAESAKIGIGKTGRRSARPGSRQDREAFQTVERARSEPPRSTLPERELRVNLDQDLFSASASAIRRESESSTETLISTHETNIDELRRIVEEIQRANNGREIERLLTCTTFSNGSDTVLHFAASTGDYWTMEYALDYVRVQHLSVDIVDSAGHTPLEAAIQANREEAVGVLLDAGASVHRRQDQKMQPLHFAIRKGALADICGLLLDHGADPNAHEAETCRSDICSTPLALAWQETYVRQMSEEAYVTAEILLDRGAVLPDSNVKNADRGGFLHHWLLWKQEHACNYHSRRSWLRNYFRTGWSPFCWFPLQCCPSRECGTLAAFVFSHTDLGMELLDTSDCATYATDFACAILSPCTSASRSTYSMRCDLLRKLLERSPKDRLSRTSPLVQDASLLLLVLERSPEDDVVATLEVLLEAGRVSSDERRRALIYLARSGLHSRLQVAEMLLTPCQDSVSRTFYDQVLTKYCKFWGLQDLSAQPQNNALFLEYRSGILSDIGFQPNDLDEGDSDFILQCVIHVLSRLMLEGDSIKSPFSTESRLALGIDLRQRFDLPGVSVPPEVLSGLFKSPVQTSSEVSTSAQNSDYGSADISMESVHLLHGRQKSKQILNYGRDQRNQGPNGR